MKKSKVVDLLKYWLSPKATLFKAHKEFLLDSEPQVIVKNGFEQFIDNPARRIFIDRGSKVLFVAHIDTVQTPQFKKEKSNRIWASGLDDRLGCMLTSELSRILNTDLLICDYEESAATSGSHHDLKDYNWIAEFDRNGGDVVTYDLECDEFVSALEKYFNLGWGSFSDICSLRTTACCVNVGIGYKHDHSEDSYVDLEVMNNMIEKFRRFYYEFKDTAFVQDPDRMYGNNRYYQDYFNRDMYGANNYSQCDYCGNIGAEEIHGARICQECFETMTSNYVYADFEEYREASRKGYSKFSDYPDPTG